MSDIKLDIFCVEYNSAHVLVEMCNALGRSVGDFTYRLLVVDNASVFCPEFMGLPFDFFVRNESNVGFGRANNQLLSQVQSDFILLLNTDAFVSPDTLDKSLSFMQANPECGVLGVRLLGRDGDLQPSCRYFPTPLNVFLSRTGLARLFPWVQAVDDMTWDHASARECDWVPGCYYLVRRDVVEQVGLFDPRYFLYYEEVDHCKRVKEAGWQVWFYPDTTVVHIGGESAKSAGEITKASRQISSLQVESELLYFRKHHGRRGLALHLIFSHLGDSILALKDLIRGRGFSLAGQHFKNSRMVRSLCRQTRWGRQATR